jgi:hypothetical protein
MKPYRGQRKDNGEWVEGWLFVCNSDKCAYILPDECCHCELCGHDIDETDEIKSTGFVEVLPETVGEFTGEYDKNNKKVYENAMFKCESGRIGKIIFFNAQYWVRDNKKGVTELTFEAGLGKLLEAKK